MPNHHPPHIQSRTGKRCNLVRQPEFTNMWVSHIFLWYRCKSLWLLLMMFTWWTLLGLAWAHARRTCAFDMFYVLQSCVCLIDYLRCVDTNKRSAPWFQYLCWKLCESADVYVVLSVFTHVVENCVCHSVLCKLNKLCAYSVLCDENIRWASAGIRLTSDEHPVDAWLHHHYCAFNPLGVTANVSCNIPRIDCGSELAMCADNDYVCAYGIFITQTCLTMTCVTDAPRHTRRLLYPCVWTGLRDIPDVQDCKHGLFGWSGSAHYVCRFVCTFKQRHTQTHINTESDRCMPITTGAVRDTQSET